MRAAKLNVDWREIAGAHGEVVHQNPAFGTDRAYYYEDHLLIRLPLRMHVEVVWDDPSDSYSVYLFGGDFGEIINRRERLDAAQAVAAVKELVELATT